MFKMKSRLEKSWLLQNVVFLVSHFTQNQYSSIWIWHAKILPPIFQMFMLCTSGKLTYKNVVQQHQMYFHYHVSCKITVFDKTTFVNSIWYKLNLKDKLKAFDDFKYKQKSIWNIFWYAKVCIYIYIYIYIYI